MASFYSGKTVFITGATGLVGSWLVEELLAQGAQPVCLVRDFVPSSRFFFEAFERRVRTVRGNLEDYFVLERTINEYEPSVVFHLGAQTLVPQANRSPLATFEANIRGTYNLLEACRVHGGEISSIMVASSDKAYGSQVRLPYTEDMPLDGRHPYDASKSCADILAQTYANTYGMPIVISRCGNFFGGGDLNFNRIVPGTIRSLYNGEAPIVRSDGKYIRDYIYVRDAVSAYLTLGEKYSESLRGQAFNFSNETQLDVLSLIQIISKIMGKEKLAPIIQNKPINEIRNQHLSAKKAASVLGWKAKWGIKDGLKETVKWYSDMFAKEGK